MAFQVFSSAFSDGGWIPDLHTCQGADVSPSLEWSGEPAESRSYALILDDPDAPMGNWNHWLVYDIASKTHNLPQGYKPGGIGLSGLNSWDRPGYGGPCPPRGRGPHRYFFRLSALDVETLGLTAGARREALERAMKGHVLAEAQCMGRYERR
ncbi:MAG: YbhB/YbcL family Raf kinase inhibitor-like protein [Acidobacteriia bacterium]|nr:YbhB/YbcL family Raf kinase inhibitor-like protein [Terriglobia bacterium]